MTPSVVLQPDEHILWHRRATLKAAARALEANGFTVRIADDAADACRLALDAVPAGACVGLGGSQTLRQIGFADALRERGHEVAVSLAGMSPAESLAARRRSVCADVFAASPNAVTRDGSLVIVDMIGNRAAGMVFGPPIVIAVAGINKIVADEQEARRRIDEFTGPVNGHRLGYAVPCAVTGLCADCEAPQRMCRAAVTLWKRPVSTDYTVILVPEVLGY